MDRFFVLLDAATWGFATIPMLIIFGVAFTLFTSFSQFRFFPRMFADLLQEKRSAVGISGRKALLFSVGGRVGAGNIAGVSIAISLGGPGAVFWMWVLAVVGMATMLVECTLAQLYKRKMPDGNFRGGPLQTIIFGLGYEFRWLAVLFALSMIAAYGIAMVAFQSNTAVEAMKEGLSMPHWLGGVGLAGVFGAVIFGGIRRIAQASEVMVPIMAIAYIAMAILVILNNLQAVPGVIADILANAFGFREAVSGGIGAALLHGTQRGLLSNEAGIGSASNVAGAAFARHPVDQGITQAFGVFIDTVVICSCTAFIILLSDDYVPGSLEIDGIALAQRSLAIELGTWTSPVLSIIVALIVLSSLTYVYYLAENGLAFLTRNKLAIHALRIIAIVMVIVGALAPSIGTVLFFLDPLIGLMAIINLIVIAMLFPKSLSLIKDYRSQLSVGKGQPVFNAEEFGDVDVDMAVWR